MNTPKKRVQKADSPIAVRLPKTIITQLDKLADRNCRSRSAEIKSRLMNSLAAEARS